jgi:acyl dehydratase
VHSGVFIRGKTTTSFVTPDDSVSESEAKLAAEKIIRSVTNEDIKRFAAEFDPQPFHLDEAAAEKTAFKGLAASRWHTAAISMRLCVEVRPFGPHPLMGLGVDDLRWMMPVRPGDVLHVEGEVVELIPSRTKPQGIAKVKWTAYNQCGEAVYTFTPIGVVPRRPNPAS